MIVLQKYTNIERNQLIQSVGTLSENRFIACCYYLLSKEYGHGLYRSRDASNVWYSKMKSSGQFLNGLPKQFYIIDYLPYELFVNPADIPFDNPSLRGRVLSICNEFKNDPPIFWSHANLYRIAVCCPQHV